MNTYKIELIREMVAEGCTNEEIQSYMQDYADALIDAKIAAKEDREMYGSDDEDERSSYQKETCDRLDMGRNDAGEWLGYC